MSISGRLLVAAACIVAAQVPSRWLDRRAKADVAPTIDVTGLPMRLADEWEGSEAEIDPQVARVRGALGPVLNRHYESGPIDKRRHVTMHMASFPSGEVALPHLPDVCYPAAGWKISGDRMLGGEGLPPHRSFVAEREDRQVLVSYWYQLGPNLASDRDSLRKILQDLRMKGRPTPPLVKVLMEAEIEGSRDAAEADIEQVGHAVYDWVLSNS